MPKTYKPVKCALCRKRWTHFPTRLCEACVSSFAGRAPLTLELAAIIRWAGYRSRYFERELQRSKEK